MCEIRAAFFVPAPTTQKKHGAALRQEIYLLDFLLNHVALFPILLRRATAVVGSPLLDVVYRFLFFSINGLCVYMVYTRNTASRRPHEKKMRREECPIRLLSTRGSTCLRPTIVLPDLIVKPRERSLCVATAVNSVQTSEEERQNTHESRPDLLLEVAESPGTRQTNLGILFLNSCCYHLLGC